MRSFRRLLPLLFLALAGSWHPAGAAEWRSRSIEVADHAHGPQWCGPEHLLLDRAGLGAEPRLRLSLVTGTAEELPRDQVGNEPRCSADGALVFFTRARPGGQEWLHALHWATGRTTELFAVVDRQRFYSQFMPAQAPLSPSGRFLMAPTAGKSIALPDGRSAVAVAARQCPDFDCPLAWDLQEGGLWWFRDRRVFWQALAGKEMGAWTLPPRRPGGPIGEHEVLGVAGDRRRPVVVASLRCARFELGTVWQADGSGWLLVEPCANPRSVTVAPDGAIAFSVTQGLFRSDQDERVWGLEPDARDEIVLFHEGRRRVLASFPVGDGYWGVTPAFSPDARQLAFSPRPGTVTILSR